MYKQRKLFYAVTVSVSLGGNEYGFCLRWRLRSRLSPMTRRNCSSLPRVRRFWSSLHVDDDGSSSCSGTGTGSSDPFRLTRRNSGTEHKRSFRMWTMVATSRRGRPFGSCKAGFRAPLNVPEYTLSLRPETRSPLLLYKTYTFSTTSFHCVVLNHCLCEERSSRNS